MTRILKKTIGNAEEVKIIIIVVTYNSKPFIANLIKSILYQDYDLSKVLLVIIDNSSIDGTIDELLRVLPKNHVINYLIVTLDRNLGFVPANNLGLNLIGRIVGSLKGKVVLFLNPDTKILSRDFLKVVDKLSKSLPIVGFATISNSDNVIDSLGAYVDFLGNALDILPGVKLTPSLRKFVCKLPIIYFIPCACFAAVAVNGDVLQLLGPLKDYYIMTFDDAEFCLRAWSSSIPVAIYKEFTIWHARSGTLKAMKSFKKNGTKTTNIDIIYHASKNSLLLTFEYLGLVRYIIKVVFYAIMTINAKYKHLSHSILGSLRIIFRKKVRRRRLPRGLIPKDLRTCVSFWALKYFTNYPGRGLSEAITYGVKRASFEYLKRKFIRPI